MEGYNDRVEKYLIDIRDRVVKVEICQNENSSDIRDIKSVIKSMDDSLNSQTRQTVVQEQRTMYLEQRVAQLEDTNKWLMRLVIGSIILSALGAFFTFNK